MREIIQYYSIVSLAATGLVRPGADWGKEERSFARDGAAYGDGAVGSTSENPGQRAHPGRYAWGTGGTGGMMYRSPSRSWFRCEACGALRRAAVESLICQVLYTYSCSRLA